LLKTLWRDPRMNHHSLPARGAFWLCRRRGCLGRWHPWGLGRCRPLSWIGDYQISGLRAVDHWWRPCCVAARRPAFAIRRCKPPRRCSARATTRQQTTKKRRSEIHLAFFSSKVSFLSDGFLLQQRHHLPISGPRALPSDSPETQRHEQPCHLRPVGLFPPQWSTAPSSHPNMAARPAESKAWRDHVAALYIRDHSRPPSAESTPPRATSSSWRMFFLTTGPERGLGRFAGTPAAPRCSFNHQPLKRRIVRAVSGHRSQSRTSLGRTQSADIEAFRTLDQCH